MIADSARQTIFVSIASYRDPDCQNTVNDLFEKARHPDRISIGICLQIDPEEDADCLVAMPSRSCQLRIIEIPAWEARGACWARSRIQSLWQGEDYFFQIDSHMRFVPGWDEKLIAMLAKCPSGKPVLSTYPLGFTPPNNFAEDALVVLRPKWFDELGIILNGTTLTPIDKAPLIPSQSFLIGAGLIFSAGKMVEEVPYDPYSYFVGEEISLAVRLWTSGWDMFTPNEVIAYHDYGVRPDRLRHWNDDANWAAMDQKSRRRISNLLGVRASNNPDDLVEIEKYGLGKIRSINDYETASGIDFKAHTYKGVLLPHEQLIADKPQQITQRAAVFASIWAKNSWGNAESRSGPGSTISSTAEIRARLPEIFHSLDVAILADAGCGDLNWMKELTGGLRLYLGYDIVPGLIDDLRSRYGDRENCFFKSIDIVTASLPACDAILCRDCLTHLSLDAAHMALKRFRQSGARFLLATTHSIGHNDWVRSGWWYAMDLTAPPFNLPPPRHLINEAGSKMLGIWDIAGLPE